MGPADSRQTLQVSILTITTTLDGRDDTSAHSSPLKLLTPVKTVADLEKTNMVFCDLVAKLASGANGFGGLQMQTHTSTSSSTTKVW